MVTIIGYDDDAMEPFVTPDYLLWNNRNDPAINTDLHYAVRIDDLTFDYRGRILGANTQELKGTPTMDQDGWLYFVSTRSYFSTYSTIYRAHFSAETVSKVTLVPNVSLETPGMVNFDVGVSPDGLILYFVDGLFGSGGLPKTADLVLAYRRGIFYKRSSASNFLLGAVNTDVLEYAPAVSADGLELYFTRFDTTPGNAPAIFVATRDDPGEPFGEGTLTPAAEGSWKPPPCHRTNAGSITTGLTAITASGFIGYLDDVLSEGRVTLRSGHRCYPCARYGPVGNGRGERI